MILVPTIHLELTWKECRAKIQFWLSIYRWGHRSHYRPPMLGPAPQRGTWVRRACQEKGGSCCPDLTIMWAYRSVFRKYERRKMDSFCPGMTQCFGLFNSSCLLCIVTTDHHLSKHKILPPKFQTEARHKSHFQELLLMLAKSLFLVHGEMGKIMLV